MTRDAQDRLAVLASALICLGLYFNSLWNSFVFDDFHMVVDNTYIKDLHFLPVFFRGFVTSFPAPKGMFRPLLMWTFSFNYLFSGLPPLGYHIVNVLLHFLNGILVYSFLRLLIKDIPYGLNLIITFLFLAHPINNEAVGYISCRSDLLVTLFIGLGMLVYTKKNYFLALLFYLAALLTKENAISFGLLIFLYDFVFLDRDYRQFLRSKKFFYLSLIGLTLLYLFYRKILFGGAGNLYPVRSLYSNLLTQSAVTLYYLRLFFWPYPLNIHHALPILDSLFKPLAIISILFILTLILSIFRLREKKPLVSFGLGWFLICLAPQFYAILNIIAAEQHFYLPSIGIYLILAVLTQRLYSRFRRQYIYISAGLIGIFAILVLFRNLDWRNGLTLWKAAVKTSANSATSHHNLGVEYIKAGLYQEAERELKTVLSISNTIDAQIDVGMNLANIYRKQGKFKEAIDELNKVRKLNPDYFGAFNELGVVYIKIGQLQKAEEIWKEGLKIYPRYVHFHINLGLFYFLKGQFSQARDYFQSAIKCDPDAYLAYFGLGQVLEAQSDADTAIKAYRKSISLNPAYAYCRYALGTIYAGKGDLRALNELKEAVRLDPSFAAAHNNLSVLYASMDPPQLELARKHAQKAMVLGYKLDKEFLKKIDLLPKQ